MLSLPPERPICHRWRRADNRGSCHVDAARAGESGDPAADCRHHPREGARGPARPGRGVRPPVLPAAGPRGPARAGAGRPVRRRPGPLAPGPPPPARRGQGPGLQPPLRGARLALQALHRGDRHRRHAVPGRLGGHGAEPPRPGHPPAHPPGGRRAPRRGRRAGRGAAARRHRRHPRVVPALRGRPPERPRGAGPAAGRGRADPGGRQGLRRGLGGRCASRSSRSWRELDERPPPVDEAELAEARALLEWIDDHHFTFLGYRSYDLVQRGRRGHAAPGARHRPRHPAPGPDQAGLGQLRQAAAGGQAAGPGAARPRPDQGQLALDRAPAVVPGLHRGQALRRAGRGRRRAALPRPVHLGRLQPEPARHPGAAPQGGQGAGAGRPAPLQPRLEVAAEHPGDVPARRAVPDLRRPAVRDGHGHPAAGGAPPGAAVHVARRLRPLRVRPGLRAPRPLHHHRAPAHRGGPQRGLPRGQLRLPGVAVGVGAGPAALHHPDAAGPDAELRRQGAGGQAGHGHPLLDRRAPRPAAGAARRGGGQRPVLAPTARRSRPPTWTTSRPATPSTTSSAWRTWPSGAGST